MNKTIHINPDLFKISGTRKSTTPKKLSINIPKEHNKTLSKRNTLLKFIRKHHDKPEIDLSNPVQETDSEFEMSLQYLMDISDSTDKTHENVNMKFPEQIQAPTTPTPQYGCLKNGNLPTYRQFYNRQTLKNHTGMGKHIPKDLGTVENVQNKENVENVENVDTTSQNECKTPVDDFSGDVDKSVHKILKRTYKIGKSDSERKISVLVSNKTIRHNASNKNITLKKTPINDVRRYLVKQGLVKVGTTAPPDVLRKMYESASMVCGDVTNHNPETLLYNFINSPKKTW
jgi:hypothetical protein